MTEPAAPTRPRDDLLDGRYLLLAELATGGTARVYLAEDTLLTRRVAIKILHEHLAADDVFVDRFRREALAAAQVAHPHVVTLFDVAADGSYLVMEHVDGMSLRDVLQLRGRLRPAEALSILGPAAAGLSAAHAVGLVHRDVKPENILLARDGSVKIGDFGLARAAASASVTFGEDVFAGSPRYCAPEAVRGEVLDERTDVYALGVILYECLTGQPPFEADTPFATAMLHTSSRVPQPSAAAPAVTRSLDEVVQRATAPDPRVRYRDAAAFVQALTRAVPEGPTTVDLRDGANPTVIIPVDAAATIVSAHPPEAPPRAPRRRWPAVLVALLVVAAGCYAAWDRLIAPVTAIPSVVGIAPEDATATLASAGFEVAVVDEPIHDRTVPAGRVADVAPSGHARRGRTITLTLSAGPRQVEVPVTYGLEESLAVARLSDAGFEVEVERVFHDEIEAGLTVRTRPDSGDALDEGGTIYLMVSRGREPIQLPSVSGMPEELASGLLRDLGFVPVVVGSDVSPDVPAGAVLAQDPPAGETLHRGDQVQLRISEGPPPFAMPDVRDKQEGQARRQLEGLGLVVEVEYVDTRFGFRKGLVDEQDPEPGRDVRAGDVVTLFVWR